MKALPIDIEKIDDFYKHNLQDLTIEPDASVWANIESGLNTSVASQASNLSGTNQTLATKSVISNLMAAKTIATVAVVSVAIGLTTYIFITKNTGNQPFNNSNINTIPSVADSSKFIENEISNETSKAYVVGEKVVESQKNEKNIDTTPTQKEIVEEPKQNVPQVEEKVEIIENKSTLETAIPTTDSVILEKTVQEEIANTENKTIKKPKSFYEKYAEKLKDSTRDIFVPRKSKK